MQTIEFCIYNHASKNLKDNKNRVLRFFNFIKVLFFFKSRKETKTAFKRINSSRFRG